LTVDDRPLTDIAIRLAADDEVMQARVS
jgi:hypothetical protein